VRHRQQTLGPSNSRARIEAVTSCVRSDKELKSDKSDETDSLWHGLLSLPEKRHTDVVFPDGLKRIKPTPTV